MSTHNLCFEHKFEKYQNFLYEIFHFVVVKFSVHLNRCVFVMFSRGLAQLHKHKNRRSAFKDEGYEHQIIAINAPLLFSTLSRFNVIKYVKTQKLLTTFITSFIVHDCKELMRRYLIYKIGKIAH